MESLRNLSKNNNIIILVKLLLSLCILVSIVAAFFVNGLKPYYSYRDFSYRNEFSKEDSIPLDDITLASQSFVARGTFFDRLYVYLGDITGKRINITLKHGAEELASTFITGDEYIPDQWNIINNFSYNNLIINDTYEIEFSSEDGLSSLYFGGDYYPFIFKNCIIDNSEEAGNLAIEILFSYRYLSPGNIVEITVASIFALLSVIALCFAIFHFEELISSLKISYHKSALLASLYFSVPTVLIHYPLENSRNQMTMFSRVIGQAVKDNIDVSKRINNFTIWIIEFGIFFGLFLLLWNYLINKTDSEENKKILSFLDNYFILANCCLLLRCITYFKSEQNITAVFSFTSYAVMLIALIAIAYVMCNLQKKISPEIYAKIQFIGLALSLPLTVFTRTEWMSGRVLLGWWFILSVCIIIFFKFLYKGKIIDQSVSIDFWVLAASFLPLITSTYIELIHVLNQYEIFIRQPAKYYIIGMIIFIFCVILCTIIIKKSKKHMSWMRTLSMPVFIFGVGCLCNQIPISSQYNPDLFEGANYSILISDFLNYGKIPLVEHYGGHMMSRVWEGILYGVINRDFSGAFVSPYANLINVFLILLFYYLVKIAWNEDVAPFVTILFPFWNHWYYYGLGMLVCLAAMAYVKKNTYFRAFMVWAAFIWCALYRLDLGFAFGFALVLALIIYIIIEKNFKAFKQLGITLLVWGVSGCILWTVLCMVNGINPINRLIEFLQINLSNQNWAFSNIGNTDRSIFSWTYIFIPLFVTFSLGYTVFSRKMRKRIGNEYWMLLLIFGLSYYANFSRGIVRHSLAEMNTTVTLWTAYLTLALFISAYHNNPKLFLPFFMGLMLCNNMFVRLENFTDTPVADSAVSRPASIIESWGTGRFSVMNYEDNKHKQNYDIANGVSVDKDDLLPDRYMTYWEQNAEYKRKINRVRLNKDLLEYTKKYNELLSALLDENETFADFVNKTLLYSVLNKENPVYISQSPLQLSGDFTQKEFIKEIKDIPVILMPIDTNNYRASNNLDGITNAYRYYRVSEYIYQNYQPLCRYDEDFAVWCLKTRFDEFKNKLPEYVTPEYYSNYKNYAADLAETQKIGLHNVELNPRTDHSVVIAYTDRDPFITELQTVVDISKYFDDEKIDIVIVYSTDLPGIMQLFYTTDEGESYSEPKSIKQKISSTGIAHFSLPVTEYTRLRLDTPEKSNVEIKGLYLDHFEDYEGQHVYFIEYGYDGPYIVIDGNDNVTWSYVSALHNHNLRQLPRIWAETDQYKAVSNPVVSEANSAGAQFIMNKDNVTRKIGNTFIFDPETIDKTNGNYLLIRAAYDGSNANGTFSSDDEFYEAWLMLGNYDGEKFEEKCKFALTFKEGTHEYLVRVSTDYYWYINEINAAQIQSDGSIYDISMKILEGD